DTVLFEDEINPVMSVALDNGLNVTALHNHFFFDHPKVYFMHIEGQGVVDKLAGAVRKFTTLPNRFARQIRNRKIRSAQYHCRKKILSMLVPLIRSLKHKVNQEMEC